MLNRGARITVGVQVSMMLVSACTSPTGSNAGVVGPYGLTSVDGSSAPVSRLVDGTTYTLGYAAMDIMSSGFESSTNTIVTVGSTEVVKVRHCAGTVARHGSNVHFIETASAGTTCGRTYDATWDGTGQTLTIATSQLFDPPVSIEASSKAVYTKAGKDFGF